MAQGHPYCQTVSNDKSNFNHHSMTQGHPDFQTVEINQISTLNSLPNDWSKFKAFADDRIKVLKIMTFVFDRV